MTGVVGANLATVEILVGSHVTLTSIRDLLPQPGAVVAWTAIGTTDGRFVRHTITVVLADDATQDE